MKKGQTVYTEEGTQLEYMCSLQAEGHIVRVVYNEGGTSEPFFRRHVYEEPPTKKFHEELLAVEDKIENLRIIRDELVEELHTMKAERDEIMKGVQKHRVMKRIWSFLNNEITHFVVATGSRVNVKDAVEILNFIDYRGRPAGLKLLTLFGKTEGDLEWRLDDYPDGSGGRGTKVFPATSYEDAVEQARLFLYPMVLNQKVTPDLISSATEFGIQIPDERMEEYRAKRKAYIKSERERIRLEIKNCQAQLNELDENDV